MKQGSIRNFKFFAAALFILMTTGSGTVISQQPYLRHVAQIDDFGEGQINLVYQDRQGFIWIGATSGAYRFDGTDFVDAGVPDSILNKSVTALYEDSTGRLWFGFADGNILRTNRFGFDQPMPVNRLPGARITSIAESNDARIWFGTYGEGIYVLEKDTLRHINSATGLSDDYIYCLILNRTEIWAGTDDGINICRFENQVPVIRKLSVADGLPDFIVQSLETVDNGSVWIGMHEKGICRYDVESRLFQSLPGWNSGSVEDVQINGSSVWILTREEGITEYNPEKETCTPVLFIHETELPRFSSMMSDREGNVWLISGSSIYLTQGRKIGFLGSMEGHSFTNIHALITDKDDNIWFANDEAIYGYQPQAEVGKQLRVFPIDGFPEINKVVSLYRDVYGFLWIGTFGNGLVRVDPESGSNIHISENEGLNNGNVLTIEGSQAEIWFGTLGGAFRCDVDERLSEITYIPEFESFGKEEGLSNNFIYHVLRDDLNRIWFATDGSGVFNYENGGIKGVEPDSGFRNRIIYSLAEGQDGTIWMNTAQGGLTGFNGRNYHRLLQDKPHQKLLFSGIIANLAGELVMAYDDGIDVLNPVSGSIHHFGENAGLNGIYPDINAMALDSDGNTWIGTSRGIIRYAPQPSIWSDAQPRITNVKLYLQPVDSQSRTTFGYNENHISFDFSGLWYQMPEQVEFLVKLEGHDLDWIRTKNKNIIYSSLPHGKYTFRVKAGLYDHFDATPEATYSFTIRQPFWISPWFLVLLTAVIASFLTLYIRRREVRLKREQEALHEKLRFQFENLKTQINPHFLFNSFSTLISLIDLDKETAIEYVEELSNLFRHVLEFKDQDVISLNEELKIIGNYYRLQKKRYGKNLDLRISEIENPERVKIPPMTLQLLIENAIKHNVVSKENPLQIRIFADYDTRYIYVDNDRQEKKEPVASTGIGIRNIIDRYNILTDRKIQIIQNEESFRIGLPFIN